MCHGHLAVWRALGTVRDMPGQITPTEVAQQLKAGRPLVLVDVREPAELALASIPNARHIPMNDIPARMHELDANAEIVVFCHHGMRSANVAEFLAQQGFTNVVNLTGGIDAWSLSVDPGVPRY